jgi:hypothetical protein
MIYEEFLEEFRVLEKTMKDSITKLIGIEKKLSKDIESGDVKAAEKDISLIEAVTQAYLKAKEEVGVKLSSFDYKEYFLTGAFTEEMLSALRDKALDVVGEYPSFEVFPTKIRLDAENQEVVLGKKKVSTMRPERVAVETRALVDKLESASFNALSFAQDLENAYTLLIAKENEKANSKKFTFGAYLTLLDLYKLMVPLSRSRKDYDETAFAFDIARLYIENEKGGFVTKSGRSVSFSTGRGKGIRILDANGREQIFSTISFR